MRFLGLLLVLSMCLAACDCGKKPSAPAPKPAPVVEAPAPKPAPKKTLRTVHAPLIFRIAEAPERVEACLKVQEIAPDEGFGGVQAAYDALVQAVQKKDGAAFEALLAPEDRGPKCGDKQRRFWFEQNGKAFQFDHMAHAYTFDDIVLVDAVVVAKRTKAPTTLAFSVNADGSLSFRPCRRMKSLGFELVEQWLSDPRWRTELEPQPCDPALVDKATHSVPLTQPARADSVHLLFRGASLAAPGDELKASAARVSKAVTALQKALDKRNVPTLARLATREPFDAAIKQPWAKVGPEGVERYAQQLRPTDPYFFIEAKPAIIVYTRGDMGVSYFTQSKTGALSWTRYEMRRDVDNPFDRMPMTTAAKAAEPFAEHVIKR